MVPRCKSAQQALVVMLHRSELRRQGCSNPVVRLKVHQQFGYRAKPRIGEEVADSRGALPLRK